MKDSFLFICGYIWSQIQTTIHKFWVIYLGTKFILKVKDWSFGEKTELFFRLLKHDLSKYRWSEVKGFAKTIFELKNTTYGTDRYKEILISIKPNIELHYKRNSHHPEHFKNGIKGMSCIDEIEMIIDWLGATKRHADGNIYKSLEINQTRFGYPDSDKEYFRSIINTILR